MTDVDTRCVSLLGFLSVQEIIMSRIFPNLFQGLWLVSWIMKSPGCLSKGLRRGDGEIQLL